MIADAFGRAVRVRILRILSATTNHRREALHRARTASDWTRPVSTRTCDRIPLRPRDFWVDRRVATLGYR